MLNFDSLNMKPEKPTLELFKGVMLAHMILGLHVVLICLIGLIVIFFGGIARYWGWIFPGRARAHSAGAYCIYRKLKSQGRDLIHGLPRCFGAFGRQSRSQFSGRIGIGQIRGGPAPHRPPEIAAPPAPPLATPGKKPSGCAELTHLARSSNEKELPITRGRIRARQAGPCSAIRPPPSQIGQDVDPAQQ